ncbi:MAG TPA: hypothetical protein VHM64_17945 [Candidatus Binatia bacterium]|nr:hypothetical protein [Candidatus Binatia bacterium]
MWEMIVLLWSVPFALGTTALVRLGRGENVLRDAERQFLFGSKNNKELRLSGWLGIKLAVLSILLFLAGVFHGLVVVNFGSPWTLLLPLLTASCVTLLLVVWLRAAASDDARAEQDPLHDPAHQPAMPAHRLDSFEL